MAHCSLEVHCSPEASPETANPTAHSSVVNPPPRDYFSGFIPSGPLNLAFSRELRQESVRWTRSWLRRKLPPASLHPCFPPPHPCFSPHHPSCFPPPHPASLHPIPPASLTSTPCFPPPHPVFLSIPPCFPLPHPSCLSPPSLPASPSGSEPSGQQTSRLPQGVG